LDLKNPEAIGGAADRRQQHHRHVVNGDRVVFQLTKRNVFMDELILLTDGSVNTRSHIGYGAYLAVSEAGLSLESLRKRVKVRRFEHTSSTKLELQTLLWALSDIQTQGRKVIVYTDSQNIMSLPGRRDRFEQNDYRSKKNKRLNNYKLYQAFYRRTDQLDCEFVKVRGHMVSSQKDDIDRLFTLVDSASRHALRGEYR
jgi:ribonuclease HI